MKLLLFISWIFLFLLTNAQTAVAQKRIYLAPDDHTDYMWTADEAGYENAFLTMIDYYLDQMDASGNDPSHHQARWNADGSFWMWVYQKNRTSAQFQRLINRIKSGHFSMPLNALVLSNGGTPAEAVLRGMYYPGQIQRAYDVDFPIAIAMENQTLPYGLSSLWAGSGAKYSWKGVCNCASHVPHLSNRDREIYYMGGPDGSRVLMKWYSYQLINNNEDAAIGSYAEGRDAYAAVDFIDNDAKFKSLYPFPVIGVFGKGEDDLLTTDNVFVTTAKDLTTSKRKIVVSNQLDFFKDFETHHGADLETFAASYGNEWELYSASMSEVSARIKRAVEKLRSADAMATLVALQDPTFMDSRSEARNKAMLNFGLYYEHNWTADGQVARGARAEWQRKIEGEITSYVDTLYDDASNQLGGMIAKKGVNPRFYVFNSLSWARTDYADFPIATENAVHVVDISIGEEVPSQYVTVNGVLHLRILAKDVPPVGYKVFEIRNGAGAVFAHAATVDDNTLENDFYRITVSNTGAITSLLDKKRGDREFVRAIDGKTLNDLGGRQGIVMIENIGAVSVTLKSVSEDPLRHTTFITLLRGSNRIDISNTITQNFSDVLSWNYSFNINSPDIWHEEVGAVIRAKLL
ncbi:glycoside hydrolase, partial [Nitrosomonas sp. JL21]|uniref:glycoside hydrolase n=1 Tax=Nitrosomonas sp. JL21 TaxID=153949 RepID=UPI00136FC1F2